MTQQTIRSAMTEAPATLPSTAPITEAARLGSHWFPAVVAGFGYRFGR